MNSAAATVEAHLLGVGSASTHFVNQSLIVRMYELPSAASGLSGPTKSIPIMYHGALTGTGLSAGTPVVSFLFILWQTSHVDICIMYYHSTTSYEKH